MPVSVQSYECCQVVVGWCLMLCHTQCNQSNLERRMARYSIESVSLSPPHFRWVTTRMRLRASSHCLQHTDVFLKWEVRVLPHPRNFVDSSTGRSVFPILTMGGLWTQDRGAVKCTTLHLWAANLKTFAHSCMEFTACCRCLSCPHSCISFTACCKCLWCARSAHENRLPGHQRKIGIELDLFNDDTSVRTY